MFDESVYHALKKALHIHVSGHRLLDQSGRILLEDHTLSPVFLTKMALYVRSNLIPTLFSFVRRTIPIDSLECYTKNGIITSETGLGFLDRNFPEGEVFLVAGKIGKAKLVEWYEYPKEIKCGVYKATLQEKYARYGDYLSVVPFDFKKKEIKIHVLQEEIVADLSGS